MNKNKHFLISALCIFSFLNIESSVFVSIEYDFMPFAQQWFETIKTKHADIGFDSATFLREGYTLSLNAAPIEWMALYYGNPSKETKIAFSKELLNAEYDNLEKIKVICGNKKDLLELNRICQLYYENPEELSVEDQEYLSCIEALFLHNMYRILNFPKKINSFIESVDIISEFGWMGSIIAYFYTKDAINKKYASSGIKIFGTIVLINYAIMLQQYFYNYRQNAYEADLNIIKHGDAQNIQGFISYLQDKDNKYKENDLKIFQTTIENVESLEKSAWSITKPSYAVLVYMLKGMQNFYIDPTRPSIETRIKYLTEALNQAN